MHRTLSFLAALTIGALAPAQSFALDFPSGAPFQSANNYPFAGPIMRYQVWYSASEWVTVAKNPVRLQEVQFATQTTGQLGKTVDLQITMGLCPVFGPTQVFDQNLGANPVVVYPRKIVTLPTTVANSYVLKFPFTTEFVWDGTSAVVLEVRIFGNGNGNSGFLYDFVATAAAAGKMTRLYTVNDPNAVSAANYQTGWGIYSRFIAANGTAISFGAGCPGAGSFVPVASTSGGLPLAGNGAWTQNLTKCSSGRAAAFTIGSSNTTWGTFSLPLDLTFVTMPGCFLLVEPLVVIGTTTSGGGPGAGSASVPLPLPPVTNYVGYSAYGQWLVDDPASPLNGKLAASQGLWFTFGR